MPFPLHPLPSVSSTGESVTRRKTGRGWGRSQIIRRRESLVLYKSLDTYWLQANNTCMAGLQSSAGIAGLWVTKFLKIQWTSVTVTSCGLRGMLLCTCLKCALQTRRPQLYLTCAQIFHKILHFFTINIWSKDKKNFTCSILQEGQYDLCCFMDRIFVLTKMCYYVSFSYFLSRGRMRKGGHPSLT